MFLHNIKFNFFIVNGEKWLQEKWKFMKNLSFGILLIKPYYFYFLNFFRIKIFMNLFFLEKLYVNKQQLCRIYFTSLCLVTIINCIIELPESFLYGLLDWYSRNVHFLLVGVIKENWLMSLRFWKRWLNFLAFFADKSVIFSENSWSRIALMYYPTNRSPPRHFDGTLPEIFPPAQSLAVTVNSAPPHEKLATPFSRPLSFIFNDPRETGKAEPNIGAIKMFIYPRFTNESRENCSDRC